MSTCLIICGDGKRAFNETCDNGNKTGCSKNCQPDRGFICTGFVGVSSACVTQCGDSIVAGS